MDHHKVNIQRRSPITFPVTPKATGKHGDWMVTLEYENEGNGPYLIDLSHRTRWDVQDINLQDQSPFNISIPETPGQCALENGLLVNRMNQTQAAIWHLSGETPEMQSDPAYTDITDVHLLVSLLGREVYSILEKVTALDFYQSRFEPPYLLQGPVSHVPCQVVNLGQLNKVGVVLIACSRGYAQDMVHALLEAGQEWGLSPAGENRLKME